MTHTTLTYSLVINAAPYACQGAKTALDFATALIEQGHSLKRVFFYGDGIHIANNLSTPQQGEENLQERWQQLAKDSHCELIICIAAALKRGLLNEQEATRYEKPAFNLAEGFEISGLGQLAEAAITCDRVVNFG